MFPNIKFYPAAKSNYTVGRGRPIKKITIHHMAGTPDTLRWLWGDPNRNASSHFGVFPDKIEQYVKVEDTAWTNSNWASNQESITIEVWGDWRNGFVSWETLNNLKELLVAVRASYPEATMEFHQDVSLTATQCPAELRGYASAVWQQVTDILFPPALAKSTITYEEITPKKVILNKTTNLWNFDFSKWADAKAVKEFPAGNIIDVVAVATNVLGARYYMTAYSYNYGNVRSTNGFNVADCQDYVEPVVETPEQPVGTPITPTVPPVTTPVTPPVITPDPVFDVEVRLTALEKLVKTITDFLDKIFKWR